MQFRILGPIEAIGRDGRPLSCTGRPLRLLALLLLDGDGVVPTEVAIEALWRDELPANPANALQVVVSRLRHVLGDGTIAWQPSGYRLRLDGPGAVDALRFEQLAAKGREALARGEHAAASGLLRDALGLWRGRALQDVRYEPFARVEAERLEELRLLCLGARIDADLALGSHAALVGELQALVAEHQLRESLRAQLMLALYRCGRQADALAAYHEQSRLLLDELGLEPSPELQALERAILRHEAGLPAPPPARPERREIVCVAVEVRATEHGRPLDPEVLGEVMTQCHGAAEAVRRAHGDPLRELRGDGIVVVFGTPVAHEDDAKRAADTAAALMARLAAIARALERDHGIELVTRTGVSAGTALSPAGAPPGALPLGEVVAAAARLAREGAPGQIAFDDRASALLRPQPAATATDAPLVGRERDLRRLLEAFERAAQLGGAQLATIIGEPGIGKSRLARELRRRLEGQATVLEGRCVPYGEAITYWPVREMIVKAARGRPLEALAAGLDDGNTVAASVGATLGLGERAPGEATPWVFRRLFAAVARDGPLVLLFEDVHWAQPPLLDLVDHLAARLDDAPVLLLCLARPELLATRPAWGSDGGRVTSVRLGFLDGDESRRLLAARAALSEAQRSAIAARAEGNPLFLEQLAAHVSDHGGPLRLPPALHALLAARLDLLSAAERALLDAAAIEGERFHLGGVLAVVDDASRAGAGRTLEALVKRELLLDAPAAIAGERAWRFRHALVHDAAYASLPKAVRADGHERVAGWLAGIEAGVAEADALIGSHLERAHRAAAELGPAPPRLEALATRAARRLSAAGKSAHRRGDLPSEITFLSRAADLLAADDRARAELLVPLAAALFEAGSLERAEAVADAAHALGLSGGLDRIRWRAAVELERLHLFLNPETVDADASFAVADRAAAALDRLGDDLGLAHAYNLAAELVWLKGSSETSYRHAERSLHHARRAGSDFEIDTAVSIMASTLVVSAIPVAEAVRRCDALEGAVAGRFAALSVRGFRAVLHAMAGRFEPARAELSATRTGLAELGLQQASVWLALYDAAAEMLIGDAAAAERALEDAERIAIEIGDRWFLSTILVDRAHAVLAQVDVGAAAEAVAGIDAVPAPNDIEWRVKRHAARGKLAALQGDAERALSEARGAVVLADATEMFTFRGDAYRDLAEVAERIGRRDDARRATATALTLYQAKENAAAAAHLRGRALSSARGRPRSTP